MRTLRVAAAWVLLLLASPGWALPPGFTLQQVHSGLTFPTTLRFAPDGRLFYTELLTGNIRAFENAFSPTAAIWATVPVAQGGERGLLGLDFHPDFPESAYVYVYHSNPSPLVGRVARLRDQAGVGIEYTVLMDGIPAAAGDHHGGRLKFGTDGLLYVTVGDQLNPAHSQDPNVVLGKILRLTPMGEPAPGNPFGPGNPAFAMGVRNPFGLCFDPVTGAGYFTEPGPDCDDEVNVLLAGGNYGWGPSDFCGGQPAGTLPALHTFPSVVTPVGCCVYRGSTYPGSLHGNLFFGAFNVGTLYRMKFEPGTTDQVDSLEAFAAFPQSLLDVTMGIEGSLWVSTPTAIYRILPHSNVGVGPAPARPSALTASPNPFRDHLALTLAAAPPGAALEILDLQGRVVRRWPGSLSPNVEWDARGADGRPVPAGVYLVRVRGEGTVVTRRVVRVTR
jgi:glucose/arabinose dehydrogenase